jgi:hypothetical protein
VQDNGWIRGGMNGGERRSLPGIRRWLVLAIVGLAQLAVAGQAEAGGTWMSLQCLSDTRQGAPDAKYESNAGQHFMNFQWCGTNEDPPAMIVTIPGNPSPGDYAQYHFDAPTGSTITRVQQWAWMSGDNAGTIRPDLFYRTPGGSEVAYASGNAPFWAFYDSGTINASRVGGALTCIVPGCSGTFMTAIDQSDVFITLNDTSPPSTPSISGSLPHTGWVRGTRNIAMNASDQGSGVAFLAVVVNGRTVASHDPCHEQFVPGTTMSRRLKPCDSNASHSFGGIETAEAPFQEGDNTVSACVAEYGAAPAVTCDTRTVKVDNVAPGQPSNLTLAGPTGWRTSNDFDLSWTNPQDSGSPLAGAVYELVNAQGQTVEGPTFVSGSTNALSNVHVPAPGQYTLRVRTRDAAGNESPAATATLRFDDMPPGSTAPQVANGWLSRSELPYVQRWQPVQPGDVPPSGIRGYAVLIDRSIGTHPCDPAGSGDRTCSESEVNFHGIGSTATTLNDLLEGSNYVHIVPVSNSGIPSAAIRHTELKVDKSDPDVQLHGIPQAPTTNEPVTLTAKASDALSGMQPLPGSDDGQPRTVIEVNGQQYEEPGDSASVTLAADGQYTVRWWARDLAGNETPAGEATQTVSFTIDTSAPDLDVLFKAKRRVRAGKKTRFSGHVHTSKALLPPQGKLVEVQVKVGKKWRTVGEAFRTDAQGNFLLKYRFRKFYTRPTRFKFRLKVLPETGWPWAEPIYSAKRKVKVVPRRGSQ